MLSSVILRADSWDCDGQMVEGQWWRYTVGTSRDWTGQNGRVPCPKNRDLQEGGR